MAIRDTRPLSITTNRFRRNMVIACLLVAVSVIVCAVVFIKPSEPIIPRNQESFVSQYAEVELPEEQVQEEVDTLNTPEKAKEYIVKYYSALAANDSSYLRNAGQTDAASAIDKQWLGDIGYRVNPSKVASPDVQAFPQQQGIYAGCSLYRIADFFTTAPTEVTFSNVSGMTGCEGWIYYDPISVRWTIADPTIPTAIAAPQAEIMEKVSSDKLASVRLSCPGVYSNAWWAYTQVSVEIANKSRNTPISVEPKTHDNGFTVSISDSLKAGVGVSPDGQPMKATDICSVYRGTISGFQVNKIGAKPLKIDGDISPLVVSYGTEDIAPAFAIGDATVSSIHELLNQEQIEKYRATNELPSLEPAEESGAGEESSVSATPFNDRRR